MIRPDGMIWADTTPGHSTITAAMAEHTPDKGRGTDDLHNVASGDVGHEGVGLPRHESDRRRNDAHRHAPGHTWPRRRGHAVAVVRGGGRRACSPRSQVCCSSPISSSHNASGSCSPSPTPGRGWCGPGAWILGTLRGRDRAVGAGWRGRRPDRARGVRRAGGAARGRCGRLHGIPVPAMRRARPLADTAAPPDPPRPGGRGRWCDVLDPRHRDGRSRRLT